MCPSTAVTQRRRTSLDCWRQRPRKSRLSFQLKLELEREIKIQSAITVLPNLRGCKKKQQPVISGGPLEPTYKDLREEAFIKLLYGPFPDSLLGSISRNKMP